jgi:preprotein translocase subunit Sss1
MNIKIKTEKERLQEKIKKAASVMGKLSALKKPKTKEFMSMMGKKGSVVRWANKDVLDK